MLKFNNDNCKKFGWCLGKDDVSPQEIFELQKQGPAERAKLAYYYGWMFYFVMNYRLNYHL